MQQDKECWGVKKLAKPKKGMQKKSQSKTTAVKSTKLNGSSAVSKQTKQPPVSKSDVIGKSTDTGSEKVWIKRLVPVVILAAICLIAALLLSITNNATAPVIAANTVTAAENARKMMFETADEFVPIDVPTEYETGIDEIYAANTAGELQGYIVGAHSKGYGGSLPIIVSFDKKGTIINVVIQSNSETPGLGKKVEEKIFTQQFAGARTTVTKMDAVTGATISSKSVLSSVNRAVDIVATLIEDEDDD